MWCARRHEKRVSCLHAPVNKELFQSLSFDGFQKIFRFGFRHESNENAPPRFGGNGVPHFGFATAASRLFMLRSVGIVRMNLDGKLVVRENEFDKERKIARFGETCSAPLGRHLPPRFP